MKCPECSHEIKAKERAVYAVCPECLTRVNTSSGKEVAKPTSTFHHFDYDMKEQVHTEYEDTNRKLLPGIQLIRCLLCNEAKSLLHLTRAALLGEGSIVKQQTVLSLMKEAKRDGRDILIQGDLGDVVTKRIKIPSYRSGYVCDSASCADEFNRLCATRSERYHLPEAKLIYEPLPTTRDNEVVELGLSKTYDSVKEAITDSDSDFTEVEHKGPTRSLGIRYHRVEDIATVSPQERAAARNRVSKLKPTVQNVNAKPSKRVRDMRKMVKG
jgi:hypothetical protein